MSKPFDVVGYTYRADIYCPDHIAGRYRSDVLARGDWTYTQGDASAEAWLDVQAKAHGIDRYDETTYDSDIFPKVIFSDQAAEDDCCGECGAGI